MSIPFGFIFCALILFGLSPSQVNAFNIREIGTKFKSMLEPLDNNRVIQSLDSHSVLFADKLNDILAALEKTASRLDGLEHRMQRIESSIEEVNRKLDSEPTIKDKRERDSSIDSDVLFEVVPITKTTEPSTVVEEVRQPLGPLVVMDLEPIRKMTEDKFDKLFSRIDRFESSFSDVQHEIHELRHEHHPALKTCVDRKYVEQLHKETNQICSDAKANEIPSEPQPDLNNAHNPSLSPTSDPMGHSTLLPYMNNLLQGMNAQMKNVTRNVDRIHWELTKGKLDDVDTAIEKIRVLFSELVEELEIKNEVKFEKPKVHQFDQFA